VSRAGGARWGTLFSLFLAMGAVAFAVATVSLSPTARLVPIFVLAPTIAFLLFELCLDLAPEATSALRRRMRGLSPRRSGASGASLEDPPPARRALLLPAGFVVGVLLLGLIWGPALVTFGYLRGVERERVSRSLVVVAVLLVFSWLVFEVGLEIELYRGIVLD
jgi:hypothetical protein